MSFSASSDNGSSVCQRKGVLFMLPPARNKRTVSLTYTSNGQKTWAISAERIVDGAKGGNNFQGCQAREKYLL